MIAAGVGSILAGRRLIMMDGGPVEVFTGEEVGWTIAASAGNQI